MLVKVQKTTEETNWILDIIDEVEDAIEHIETQIDKLKLRSGDPVLYREKRESSDLIKLKKLSLPSFSGNKKDYPAWKATFNEFVGKSNMSPEYKLLQ